MELVAQIPQATELSEVDEIGEVDPVLTPQKMEEPKIEQKTREAVAQKIGMSSEQYRKSNKIWERAKAGDETA